MRSLTDLNNRYETVEFEDLREPKVIFNPLVAVNQIFNFDEGQTPDLPSGIDIVEVVNYPQLTLTVSFIINTPVTGASLVWSFIPTGVTITNPTANMYIISGINTPFQWDNVKNPKLITPAGYTGNYSVTCNISYTGNFKTYNITGNITEVNEWTPNVPGNFYFEKGAVSLINNSPRLSVSDEVLWTVTVTPSNPEYVSLISSNSAGGAVGFNGVTKVFSISGTNNEINGHLATLRITTLASAADQFTLRYSAVSIALGSIDNAVQTLYNIENKLLGAVGQANINFVEDTAPLDLGAVAPLVTSLEELPAGSYTYTIGPLTGGTGSIANMTHSSGLGGNFSFNPSTKVTTITGTKTQVNAMVQTLVMTISADWNQNFSIIYRLTVPSGLQASKAQTFTNVEVSEEFINLGFDRRFEFNTRTYLFTENIPQITDLDATNPSYTIGLSCDKATFNFITPGGSLGLNPSKNWTYTGTKAQINDLFSRITITPDSNITDYRLFITYTQKKNGISQGSPGIQALSPGLMFDRATATNQQLTILEGASHSVPVGINITQIVSYLISNPRYVLDIRANPTATLNWPALPSGVSVSIPTPGVYEFTGIDTVAKWNAIKSPTVTSGNDFAGIWNYGAAIYYAGDRVRTWNVQVTVTDQINLSTPSDFDYTSGSTQALTGTPQIIDQGNNPPPTWTVTVQPEILEAVTNLTTAGSGGSTAFNPSTKLLTITGTKEQVNSHLASISVTTALGKDYDFKLIYTADNGLVTPDVVTQQLKSINFAVLSAVRSNESYAVNTIANITNGPQITDVGYTGNDYYTLEITAVPGASVSRLGFTSTNWFSQNKNETWGGKITNNVGRVSTGGSLTIIGPLIDYTDRITRVRVMPGVRSFNNPVPYTSNNWGFQAVTNGTLAAISTVTTGDTGQIYIYNVSTGALVTTIAVSNVPYVNATFNGSYVPRFGYDNEGNWLKLTNDYLIVGQWRANSDSGEVKVYRTSDWSLAYTLTNPNTTGTPEGDRFGFSVDANSTYLVVGSPREDTVLGDNSGRVYVYNVTTGNLVNTIYNPEVSDSGFADNFGFSVAISDTRVIIGAPGSRILYGSEIISDNGKIYIYRTSDWQLVYNLGPNNIENGHFGYSVAINELFAIVGQPRYTRYVNHSNYDEIGRISIIDFTRNQQTELDYPVGVFDSHYGFSVAVLDSTAKATGTGISELDVNIPTMPRWIEALKTLEVRNTKAVLNAMIDQIQATPSLDYNQNFDLYYKVTTPSSTGSIRNQKVIRS